MTLALEILVPEPEVVATSELKVDGKNPNKIEAGFEYVCDFGK
jgi:hypothetical protein